MKLITPLLFLLSLVDAANDNDFRKLRSELDELYKIERLPVSGSKKFLNDIVRLSYHDLLNQPKAAGKGCIQKRSFLKLQGNGGLSEAVNVLEKIIQKDQFKNANFDFGDVIAFAGKVAIETAYPCSNINFKYNRGKCGNQEPVVTSSSAAPSGNMVQLREMTPHHQYIGFSLNEFAVLTIGAHALKGADSHKETFGVDGEFSKVTSGVKYIQTTLSNTWIRKKVDCVLVYLFSNLLRIPSDMLFFPDAVVQVGEDTWTSDGRKTGKKSKKSKKNNNSCRSFQLQNYYEPKNPTFPDAQDRANQKKLQTELQQLADFDAQFVRIYEKMLNAGGGSTPYNEIMNQAHGCAVPTTTSARPTVISARPSVTSAPTVTSADEEKFLLAQLHPHKKVNNAKSLIPSSFVGFLALFLF